MIYNMGSVFRFLKISLRRAKWILKQSAQNISHVLERDGYTERMDMLREREIEGGIYLKRSIYKREREVDIF